MGRPSKPWYLGGRDSWVATVGGKQYTLARGKKNRREAERALHRLLEARDSGKAVAGPRDRPLWALFDEFLESKHRTVAGLTMEFYTRHLASFLAFMGRDRLASTVTPEHVLAWLDAPRTMRRRTGGGGTEVVAMPPWGTSTRHGAIVAVKGAFAWGLKRKKIAEDPLAEMERPGIEQRKAVLDRDDIRRVLGAAEPPFRDIVEFMWETGCRPSEAMAVGAAHADFAAGVVRMKSKTSKRTKKDRLIYLTPRAAEVLARNIADHPVGPAFRSERGSPWQRHAMAQRFARLRRKLGMGPELTAEAIRHAFGTDGALRLKPLVLAELLGHTSVAMVNRYYAHLDERKEEMRRALLDVRPDDQIN